MKKLLKLLIVLTLFLSACQKPEPYETTATSLQAVVTSDLHYIHDGSGVSSIVPLVHYSKEFMECFINQIIAEKPDVFIATGDLTNDGNASDNKELAKHLKRLKDNNITVILTTGNHDYGKNDIASFETYLFPLLQIECRDPYSLSYTTIVNDVCFLAMDDGYLTNGENGSFSKETMNWLIQQLQQAKEQSQKIIFLSHHSVLYKDQDVKSRYSITNKNLKSLLEQYQVRMCFTGHQHTQARYQVNNTNEIISSMPLTGSNQYGLFTISNQQFQYQTKQIDFNTYANDELKTYCNNLHNTGFQQMKELYTPIFNKQNLSLIKQDGIFSLFQRFVTYAQDGTLAVHYDEVLNDTYYYDMLDALHDYNYGPWMQSLMSTVPLDASHLQFTW